jgi:hypothetical protein
MQLLSTDAHVEDLQKEYTKKMLESSWYSNVTLQKRDYCI